MVIVGIDKAQVTVAKIEESQQELRDSIEETKRLSEQADRLVQQIRATLDVEEQNDR